MAYFYVLLTITLTIYGQLALKWQVSRAGALPPGLSEKVTFLVGLVFQPVALSAFIAAFLAALCWMAALTKFSLSVAYPFMSLTFVGVLVLSALLFQEPLSLSKWLGLGLLVAGLVVGSQEW